MRKIFCLLLAFCTLCLCACAKIAKTDFPHVNDDDETEETEATEDMQNTNETNAAITVDHKINAIDMNYYYVDAANEFYNHLSQQYGEYATMILSSSGLDPKLPMNQQVNTTSNQKWSDYLMEMALQAAQRDYVLCQAAKEAGFQLSEEDRAALKNINKNLEFNAQLSGYASSKELLASWFGEDADLESYIAYYEKTLIADCYDKHYAESLVYDAAQIAAADTDPSQYDGYRFSYYYIPNEYVEAVQAALQEDNSEASLEQIIAKLNENTVCIHAATIQNGILYPFINEIYRDWLAAPERKSGDVTMCKNKTEDGYYAIIFEEKNDNRNKMANVRHLLIENSADDAAAYAEILRILEEYNEGPRTEESFVQLVRTYSQDKGSIMTGGLYENIHFGSNYVAEFEAWAIDPSRLAGDVEIIQTEFGYHLMYFVSHAELSYRDQMITSILRQEALDTWYADLLNGVSISGNTDSLPFDKSLNALLGFDINATDDSAV